MLLAISQNNALFSILGTTYGGDGRTTYGLPDMRGRSAMHSGNGPGLTPRPLGQKSGTTTVTLTSNEMPSHTHSAIANVNAGIAVTDEDGDTDEADGKFLSTAKVQTLNTAANIYATGGTNGNLGGVTGGTASVANTGGSQYHTNLQPYLVVRYIIALIGIYPSRT